MSDKDVDSPRLKWASVIVIPLTTAVLTLWTTNWYNSRQISDARSRLYAELTTKREEADSALRKDMFNPILQRFAQLSKSSEELAKSGSPVQANQDHKQAARHDLEQSILSLEMLGYNFHETINLSPLYPHIEKLVSDSDLPKDEKTALQRRIHSISARILDSQLASLGSTSGSFLVRRYIQFEDLDKNPEGTQIAHLALSDGSIANIHALEYLENPDLILVRIEILPKPQSRRRNSRGTVSDAEIKADIESIFWVGRYEFPMIDNTRLKNGHRISVAIAKWEKGQHAQLAIAYFPADQAGLKDRPYMSDLIKSLSNVGSR